jgi:hypothetical protein
VFVRVGWLLHRNQLLLRVRVMGKKVTASVLIIAVAIALAVSMRASNRADAAAGNCYADTKGPSEPTVCS